MIYHEVKSLKVHNNITTIKLTANSKRLHMTHYQAAEIDAVYALLGGYNATGRAVDLDTYNELRTRFDDALHDMKQLLVKARYPEELQL